MVRICMQRFLLYQLRNTIIQPFGETAQQVFARVSAYREMMTGTGVGFVAPLPLKLMCPVHPLQHGKLLI